jgi:hypothetical protein
MRDRNYGWAMTDAIFAVLNFGMLFLQIQ